MASEEICGLKWKRKNLNSRWPDIIVNRCFYRKKVSGDYEALNDRLKTLPDQLSYDIMVSADIVEMHGENTQSHSLCIVVLTWIPVASLPFTFLTLQKLILNRHVYCRYWVLFLLFSHFRIHILPPASLTVSLSFCSFSPLSYKQVPFGPLAFMPGKLVHTNEVTALLGDNWFAKCSAKQAQKIVDHRMKCESVFEKTAFCPH